MTIMAGMETTMGGLASIARILGTDNALRESLRDVDTKVLDKHVEEFLRFESPVPTAGRTLTADSELRGCPMKQGDRILLNWAAANHDPDKFPNPDALDFERTNGSAHLAFGAGIHRCLGNHLARREIKAAIRAISELRVFELNLVTTSNTGRLSPGVRSPCRSVGASIVGSLDGRVAIVTGGGAGSVARW